MAGWDELNAKHDGLCKPDIVFFGEQLPRRFFTLLQQDYPQCDLLLVIGTSLAVMPFAALVAQVRPGTPRLLINRERVGEGGGMLRGPMGPAGALNFDGFDGLSRDGFHQGDADDAVGELVDMLGWRDEFEALRSAAGEMAAAGARKQQPRSARRTADQIELEPPPSGFTWGGVY